MITLDFEWCRIRSCAAGLIGVCLLAVAGCSSSGGGSGGENPIPPPDPGVLLDPSQFQETAPDVFTAQFNTSQGVFRVEVQRAWAPRGADRFFNLVRNGFYDDVRFFRVLSGFVAQFGLNGDPAVTAVWQNQQIPDDPVVQSNLREFVTFATGGPNTRTTQLFINFGNNAGLDAQGFAPFGRVVEGMDVVDALYAEYGEGPPLGTGPDQARIRNEGNAYLDASFPLLDFIIDAVIVPESQAP
jgi:peptidyl-prolyl cis-trans isomerase A (cyclophilin A)